MNIYDIFDLNVKNIMFLQEKWLREEKALTGNPTENMKRDLKTLTEKITTVVESYVIKN